MTRYWSVLALLLVGAAWAVVPGAGQWAHRAGGIWDDDGRCVAVASDGGSFVAGTFSATAAFTPTVTLTSAGYTDIFLAKYTAAGALTWVQRMGGTSEDTVTSLAVTPDGDVLLTGSFYSTAVFAPDVALTAADWRDVFVVKCAADGTVRWARRAGGLGHDVGNGVAATADGGALVAGTFEKSATFSDTVTVTATGRYAFADSFVARYTADGALAWVRTAGGVSSDMALGVAVAADGAALVTGYITGFATFAPGVTVTGVDSGYSDCFLAKYAADGALVWVRLAGGNNADYGAVVAASSDGGALVAGVFYQAITFAPGLTLTAEGTDDLFVAKYTAAGALAWVHHAGGPMFDHPFGLAAMADGGALVTGGFQGAATFAADVTVASAGGYDIFLARYAGHGGLLWARRAGGAGDDVGAGVAITPDGGALLVGTFAGSADFAPGLTLTTRGGDDGFLVRYGPTPVFRPDLWVRTAAEVTMTGNDRYTATGAGQTKAQTVAPGGKARYGLRLENDGNTRETFRLTVTAPPSGWTLSCWDYTSATDVAPLLLADGWRPRLFPAEARKLLITLTPAAGTGSCPLTFTLTAVDDPAQRVDVVQLLTTR